MPDLIISCFKVEDTIVLYVWDSIGLEMYRIMNIVE